jgi:phosphatidylethanolamine/phosphatidyl-N-methylethanolamine N-methyltransferase
VRARTTTIAGLESARRNGHCSGVDPVTPASASPARERRPIRDGIGFLGRFLRRPASIGAVLPSSRYLSRALVGRLDFAPGDLIVEYGPGTGPATEVIQQRLPAGARYLGIELDPRFHEHLQQRFPKLDFHLGSAADVRKAIESRGLPRPRRIVSGLPFASLPSVVQDGVIDGISWCLRGTDGDFRTFQYVHAYGLAAARRFRARMQERFDGFERIGQILRNVPPAFVLRFWGAK